MVVYEGFALEEKIVENVFQCFGAVPGGAHNFVLGTSEDKNDDDNKSRGYKAREDLLESFGQFGLHVLKENKTGLWSGCTP